MSSDRVPDESGGLTALGRSAFGQGKASISLFWSVSWKVTAVATCILFFLLCWFLLHWWLDQSLKPDQRLQNFLGLILLFGQCLFFSVWLGIAAGVFAVALRWFGAWIVVPILGAMVGSVVALFLAFVILNEIDFQGGGLHGGGEIALLLLIGFLAIAAILGAAVGSILFVGLAMLFTLVNRRRRAVNADTTHPDSMADEQTNRLSGVHVESGGNTTVT